MAESAVFIERVPTPGATVFAARGRWLVESAERLDRVLRGLAAERGAAKPVRIDLASIEALDTVGAWLLLRASRNLGAELENVPPAFAPLLTQVEKVRPEREGLRRRHRHLDLISALANIGQVTEKILGNGWDLLGFLGLVVTTMLRLCLHPGRFRPIALISHIERNGWTAIPIVGLLGFLIGIVIAFQGFDQLSRFGAQIFTVNLLGVSVTRELGVLITAIIMAGRSGSAFTAEIGAMRVNEEVDAMQTLGLDPIEVLVVPRLMGLMIALPLLTFFANIAGIFGGALMCMIELNMSAVAFLHQLKDALLPLTWWLGVIKAPFFAAIIAVVGCHAGLSVQRSAESVGRLTTISVVRSVFLVIVLDAAFSVFFVKIHV